MTPLTNVAIHLVLISQTFLAIDKQFKNCHFTFLNISSRT